MGQVEKTGDFIVYTANKQLYNQIATDSFKYALLSIPFTINRMNIDQIERRIINITKGKLAENLFYTFAKEHKIEIDFGSCATPYFQIDRRDFLWKDFEWDLKNNFLTVDKLELNSDIVRQLPCLIPNRKKGDQWDKKDKTYFKTKKGVAFLFSFMIGKLINGPLESNLININLNKDQKKVIDSLCGTFGGKTYSTAPFNEIDFWKKWDEIDIPALQNTFELGFYSPIYFTAVANKADWQKFSNTSPQSFANKAIITRINNMAVNVSELRSLLSILPS